jgi:hypothetical protein
LTFERQPSIVGSQPPVVSRPSFWIAQDSMGSRNSPESKQSFWVARIDVGMV